MKFIRTLIYVLLLAGFSLPANAIDDNDMIGVLRQAQTGNMDAQFKLGYLYQSLGKGREDMQTAVRWYEQAATQGHANAAFALGLMHEYGQGTEVSMSQAAGWYAKAARIYKRDGSVIPVRLAKAAIKRALENGVHLAKLD